MFCSDMPGMPNMQMYSRDEMEEMLQQEQSDKDFSDESDTTSYSDSESQGSIIWQTIVQMFTDIWIWIKHFLGWKRTESDEL